jgi:cysteinyl-tRNA synthetase
LDFSNDALQAAEKGLKRLQDAKKTLQTLTSLASRTSASGNTVAEALEATEISKLSDNCQTAMNDDFNSPIVIANLFEAVRIINSAKDGKMQLSASDIDALKNLFDVYYTEILGLTDEADGNNSELIDGLMQMILDIRQHAKTNKDYATSDQIRDALTALNITVKDGKDGASWNY